MAPLVTWVFHGVNAEAQGSGRHQEELIQMTIATTSRTRKTTTSPAAQQKTFTIHSLDSVEVDTRLARLAALDEEGARTLTEQIKMTTVRLWILVTEAHDRKAHLALGYETWADYVQKELNISESRSYQFLDTGHVMKAIAAAGVDIEKVPVPPTRVVARVKDRLVDVKKAAKAAADKGTSIDSAIRALAREPRVKGPGAPRGSSAPAPAMGATAASPSTVYPRVVELVTCPACEGKGKIESDLATRVRDWMNKLGSGGGSSGKVPTKRPRSRP